MRGEVRYLPYLYSSALAEELPPLSGLEAHLFPLPPFPPAVASPRPTTALPRPDARQCLPICSWAQTTTISPSLDSPACTYMYARYLSAAKISRGCEAHLIIGAAHGGERLWWAKYKATLSPTPGPGLIHPSSAPNRHPQTLPFHISATFLLRAWSLSAYYIKSPEAVRRFVSH